MYQQKKPHKHTHTQKTTTMQDLEAAWQSVLSKVRQKLFLVLSVAKIDAFLNRFPGVFFFFVGRFWSLFFLFFVCLAVCLVLWVWLVTRVDYVDFFVEKGSFARSLGLGFCLFEEFVLFGFCFEKPFICVNQEILPWIYFLLLSALVVVSCGGGSGFVVSLWIFPLVSLSIWFATQELSNNNLVINQTNMSSLVNLIEGIILV